MDLQTSVTLTRTGPGTLMAKLMRRYWVPVMSSSEIAEPDGPQVRVQILGEKLLAFRDTDGKAALISEFCSHRGVSLYFGRNESGYADFEAQSWIGFLAQGGTPKNLIDRYNREMVKILKSAEINPRLQEMEFEVVATTPEQFSNSIRSEIPRRGKVIKATGARAD